MIRQKKRRKPARAERWGILNPWGDVWTYDTFDTPEAARKHVADFWRNIKDHRDVRDFRIVRVRITVSAPAEVVEADAAAPQARTETGGQLGPGRT